MASIDQILSDPAQLERMVQAVDKMSRNIEVMARVAVTAADDMALSVDNIQDKADDFEKTLDDQEKAWMSLGGASEEAARTATKSWTEYFEKTNRELEEQSKTWDKEIKKREQDMRKFSLQGFIANPMRSVQSMISGAGTAGLVAGGLLGLIVYGASGQERFRAQTASALRILDRLSLDTRRFAGAVRTDIERMFKAWGSQGQEVLATMQSLSSFSIGADMFKEATVAGRAFNASIAQTATAFDMLFAIDPGTFGTMLGQAFENAYAPIEAVSDELGQVGAMLRMTNTNAALFMSTLQQSLSGLRLQRQGVADLAQAYLSLQAGFEAGGMNREQAQQAAMRGVGAVAQGLGGLSKGMFGVIAQRMGGGSGDAFEKMMQLRLGAATPGGEFFGTMVKELKALAQEVGGGSQMRQIAFLESQGLGLEAARAIVQGMGGGKNLKEVAEAMKTPSDLMRDAEAKRTATADQFMRALREFHVSFMKIGGGILNIISAGFIGLYNLLAAPITKKLEAWRAARADVEEGMGSIQEGINAFNFSIGQFADAAPLAPRSRKFAGELQEEQSRSFVSEASMEGRKAYLGLVKGHEQELTPQQHRELIQLAEKIAQEKVPSLGGAGFPARHRFAPEIQQRLMKQLPEGMKAVLDIDAKLRIVPENPNEAAVPQQPGNM